MPLIPIAGDAAVMHLIQKAAAVHGMQEIILIGELISHGQSSRMMPPRLRLPEREGRYSFFCLQAKNGPDIPIRC